METKVMNVIKELVSKYGETRVNRYIHFIKSQESDLESVPQLGNARIENGVVVVEAIYEGKTVKAVIAA